MRKVLTLLLAGMLVFGTTAISPPTADAYVAYRLTYPALQTRLRTFHIGPSAATGYGEMTFTGYFTKVSTNRYRAIRKLAYRPPWFVAQRTTSGFCLGLNVLTHCWNEPWTWDWSKIIPNPASPSTFTPWVEKQRECANGVIGGGLIAVGTPVAGGMLALGDLLEFTPQGFVAALVGGCIIGMWGP